MYLVSPEQLVPAPVLETVPDVEELGYAMLSNVLCVLLRVIPGERGTKRQETHSCAADGEMR